VSKKLQKGGKGGEKKFLLKILSVYQEKEEKDIGKRLFHPLGMGRKERGGGDSDWESACSDKEGKASPLLGEMEHSGGGALSRRHGVLEKIVATHPLENQCKVLIQDLPQKEGTESRG